MFLNRSFSTACYLVTQVSTARTLAVWRLARSRYRLIGRSVETDRQQPSPTYISWRMSVSKRSFEVPNDSINDDTLILFSWPFDYHFQSPDMQDACPLIPAVVSHTHTPDSYGLNFNRLNSHANKNTLFWIIDAVSKIPRTSVATYQSTRRHISADWNLLQNIHSLRFSYCTVFSVLLCIKKFVALVRKRTIRTERPPPVGEVSANFCG